jgi:hypothetical protein
MAPRRRLPVAVIASFCVTCGHYTLNSAKRMAAKRTKDIRQKTSPSQGKIKDFFKISVNPAATEAHMVGSSVGRIDCGIVGWQNL